MTDEIPFDVRWDCRALPIEEIYLFLPHVIDGLGRLQTLRLITDKENVVMCRTLPIWCEGRCKYLLFQANTFDDEGVLSHYMIKIGGRADPAIPRLPVDSQITLQKVVTFHNDVGAMGVGKVEIGTENGIRLMGTEAGIDQYSNYYQEGVGTPLKFAFLHTDAGERLRYFYILRDRDSVDIVSEDIDNVEINNVDFNIVDLNTVLNSVDINPNLE